MSPGGKLASRWRNTLEQVRTSSGGRVRGYVAEQSGVPLSALLYSSQPGEQDKCGKADCNPCQHNTTKRLSCRRVTRGGQVYSCRCITCEQQVVEEGEEKLESWYHGETSRTLYSRQQEHLRGLLGRKENNALYKHKELHHPNIDPQFEFRQEKAFPDPVSKQIFEGVSINNSPSSSGLLMNSKAEYKQGEVARVVLVRGLGD